jgi:succinoglycan biosynthesis protein ExoM
MSAPTTIDVCICTFRRMHVVKTLASLAEIELPFHSVMRVIVADNDDEPSAQVTVAQAAEQFGLNLHYIHAPARNISIARNACLDAATADLVAFIDDDELVTRGWLVALTTRQRELNAPIVLGPVQAVYGQGCKAWLIEGDFHSTKPVWVRNRIITGYAGNVLMVRNTPALASLRFRLDLGVSGGEDSDFFSRAHHAGAMIDYAPEALVYEPVPAERANLPWLLKRRYRFGQTHAMMLREANRGGHSDQIKAALKAIYSYAMVGLTCLHPVKRRFWRMRAMFHRGVWHTLTFPDQPVR